MATDNALLTELEGDVPSLANQAATELDDLVIGRGGRAAAIRQFANFLKRELPGSGTPSARRMPVRATTFVVMNRAISEAKIGAPAKNVEDVVEQIAQVVDAMAKIGDDPVGIMETDQELVRRMRSFCLAYSKSASASRRTRNERPRHPFRK